MSPTQVATSAPLPPSCESIQDTAESSISSLSANIETESIYYVNLALNALVAAFDAQWLNFNDANTADALQRRTLHRFIIPDAVLSFGLWREGDDIDIYFFTHDKQERWAEVVTEALGIETNKKDLADLSKGVTMDLCDSRVARNADGFRTTYSLLQYSAKTRLVLHYCRISPECLGQINLTTLFKEMRDPLPAWPVGVPAKSYTQNYEDLRWLQQIAYTPGFHAEIWSIYPLAQAWADVHSLSAPDLITAHALVHLICAPMADAQRRRSRDDPGEQGLIDMLSHIAATESVDSPLREPAMQSLCDEETTLLTLHTHLASLAPSPPPADPAPPTPPPPPMPTPQRKSEGRFRTAAAAISRLQHDPAHAGIEYDVGYLDRFAGMMWMALGEWGGRASEDEDWIPEHRIREIVRARDGVVVWSREERRDWTGRV